MAVIVDHSTASETARIAYFVGLPSWRTIDDLGLVDRVKAGFPVAAVDTFVKRVDPGRRFLRVSDIIPKTTLHRREKRQEPLSKDESERIFALAKVVAELMRIYGDDADLVARFLTSKHPLLSGRTPLSVTTDSMAGADLVMKLIAQADAGVAA